MINHNDPKLIINNDGLVVTNLGKSFQKRPVVRSVSLQIQKGEAVGLLGPNGAGKTTCFSIKSVLITPDSGKVLFNIQDI